MADGVLANSVAIMRTMKEKAIDAANDTNTDSDRAIIQKDIDQLNDNSLVTFNGKYLFDGAADHTYSKEQTIMAALNTEWLSNSLDLIVSSTGLNFEKGDPSVKEMDVVFINDSSNNSLAWVTSSMTGNVTTKLTMTVNMHYYNNLVDGDVNGATTTAGAGYLDRTVAHEMTHAVMSANIEGFTGSSGLYACIKEGAAEVIHGIDDFRTSTIQSLADSQSIASNLTTATTTGGSNVPYAAGYVMFRYMAAQSGHTANDALTHFMESLASGKGAMTTERIDAAVSATTKGKFTSFTAMKNQMAADEAAAADGTAFLKDYCDIILPNKDTGAITGRDAGVSRVDKTAESVVPEGGSVKLWTNPDNDYTYINGLKVNWPMEYMDIRGGLYFQVGTKAAQNIHAVFSNVDAQALGLQDKDGKNLSVQTQGAAENAIAQLDKSIERALNQLTKIGALSSRLDYTNSNIITA